MKSFNCLGLAVVLSLVALTHQRLRPFHTSHSSRLVNRLLSATRHRNPRPHRKSSIEYAVRTGASGEEDDTLAVPFKGSKLSPKSDKTLTGKELKGKHLREFSGPGSSSVKSDSSHTDVYSGDDKSDRVGRLNNGRQGKQNTEDTHKTARHTKGHDGSKKKRKMFKKYGFIQAYLPQYQAQLPLSFQQNDEDSQTGFLPVQATADQQSPSADQLAEQQGGGVGNSLPQFSDVQQAAYQAMAGQTEQAAGAVFTNSEETQQPQGEGDGEQIPPQQAAYAAQLQDQQEREEEEQQQQQQQQQQTGEVQQELGPSQEQQVLPQEDPNQQGLPQEDPNQQGLPQNAEAQYQQEIEGQERQPGLAQVELQQNDAQQEAAPAAGEAQSISGSLASVLSLGGQAEQSPLGGEQRVASYQSEGASPVSPQQGAQEGTGAEQSSLEAAFKTPDLGSDAANGQGDGQAINIGSDGAQAINIGGDGTTLTPGDPGQADGDPNNAALGNGKVTSPGGYHSAAVDDNGRPIRVEGGVPNLNGYAPIGGQGLGDEAGNFDEASLKQQLSIQRLLESANGQGRPPGAHSPVQPMDDELYKIINIANPNAPHHAQGCTGCPLHAKCVDKVCIINDDQPLAHILSSLSGSDPSGDSDEQNCSSCHYNAQCINNGCVCRPGYTGDGFDCRPDTCLPGCKDHGKCIKGFCVCDHHHYFNGHSCSPYKIHHKGCPSHCLKECSGECPMKCCAHINFENSRLNQSASDDGLAKELQNSAGASELRKPGENRTAKAGNLSSGLSKSQQCPSSCETHCHDSCPSSCCKPCPANCSTKCSQSCPAHCCGQAPEATRLSPPAKLQRNIFQGLVDKFCPKACTTKQCDPNICPPLCCDSAGLSIDHSGGAKKNGNKATGAGFFENALSWFGMMNLLNMMYNTYKSNSTEAALLNKLKSQRASEVSHDSVKDNFLLDPSEKSAKCLPSCSKICSPVCPASCCVKPAGPKPAALRCPSSCKERCGAECSPNCCVLFVTKPAARPGPLTAPLPPPATSAVAPSHVTQTGSQNALGSDAAKSPLTAQGSRSGCSSICPAYCYPACTSSCCTGTTRSGAKPPGVVTAEVGLPLTTYPPGHTQPKASCPSQCKIWCSPLCPKQCCESPRIFATLKSELSRKCPSGCDARCSPSCPANCCAAADQGPEPPITARSCPPQCGRRCYPDCDKRCCKAPAKTSTPALVNSRASCPVECRPYNCLSHCPPQCCLTSGVVAKLDSVQAASLTGGLSSTPRQQFAAIKDKTQNNLKENVYKLRSGVRYSLGHSKRRHIAHHH